MRTVKGAGTPTELWRSDASGGSTWEEGSGGEAQPATRRIAVNLTPWAGQAVQIGFRFDSVDHQNNAHFGVAIDDVALSVTCAAPCASDAACTDNLPCTSERCEGGLRAYEQAGICCATFADCDDANPCTNDLCQGGLCAHVALADPPCCHAGTVHGATFGFEGGSLPAGSVVNGPAGAPAAWRVATGEATSPSPAATA